jgi:hypothetical protein
MAGADGSVGFSAWAATLPRGAGARNCITLYLVAGGTMPHIFPDQAASVYSWRMRTRAC